MPKPTQDLRCHSCMTQKTSRVYPHDFGYVEPCTIGCTRVPAAVLGHAYRGETAVEAEARLRELRRPGRSRRVVASGNHGAGAREGVTRAAVP